MMLSNMIKLNKYSANLFINKNQGAMSAFTLAEVLVTLSIIGVVSVMTIPSLVDNWQKDTYVAQLKKVYSSLSQGVKRALSNENALRMGETKYSQSDSNSSYNFLNDTFKVVKNCGTSYTPCFASNYKYRDRTSFNNQIFAITPKAVVTTADGTAIAVFNNSFVTDEPDFHYYMLLYVDVNGPKGPNISGRDLFYMEVYDDGKVGDSYIADNSEHCTKADLRYGAGCLTRIVNNGWVMDY